MEQAINLTLTIEEVNIIFKALGDQPFKEVFELVGKINAQANAQLTEDNDKQQLD